MTWNDLSTGLPFNVESVLAHVPEASGVYVLLTPDKWIYVGSSTNLRRALLQRLQGDPLLTIWKPTAFAYQRVAPEQRGAAREALARELRPEIAESLDD
jgi:hypothetical protein